VLGGRPVVFRFVHDTSSWFCLAGTEAFAFDGNQKSFCRKMVSLLFLATHGPWYFLAEEDSPFFLFMFGGVIARIVFSAGNDVFFVESRARRQRKSGVCVSIFRQPSPAAIGKKIVFELNRPEILGGCPTRQLYLPAF
jgi:hypothetical protein